MAIDFPNSPSNGDILTVSFKQCQWDGEKWLAYGVSLAPDVLKVDSGNNRVGINQTTPTVALDVTGSARITGDLTVSGTTVTVDSASVLIKDRVQFEGATANDYETILVATDPTADRTITLPDATGTVAFTSDLSSYAPLASPTFTGTVNAAALVAPLAINTQTGSYTLVLADAGKAVLMNVGSANNLTIPPNSSVAFDVGTQIVVTMIGAGVTTIVDGSGVTTNSKDNKAAIDGQYASVSLIKTATDTWLVTGALA